jgi:RNA polymerase sigma-70 factor (ECF subfamily)
MRTEVVLPVSDTFEALYRSEARKIAATLVMTGSERADASDLTAEAFVRAWERWDRVSRMDRADLWVLTVAMNLRRRRGRRRLRELPTAPPEVPARPEAPPEEAAWLRAQIRALPERQRAAIVLRYFFDLTEPQCAAVLGVRVGTVAASLSHARRALARSVAADHPPAAPAGERRREP